MALRRSPLAETSTSCANGPMPTGSRRATRSPSRTRRTAQRGREFPPRHCERSEAIQLLFAATRKLDCFVASLLAMTEKTKMETLMAKRRFMLISMVAAAIGAAVVPASAQKTLKVVQHSDIKVIDPIWSAAYIARNHGYLIYDT